MKKYFFAIISLILLFCMTACKGNDSPVPSEQTQTNLESAETEDVTEARTDDEMSAIADEDIITIYSEDDVIAAKVENVYELSDLAVRVGYVKTVDTYAQKRSGAPITIAAFEVHEVFKGEYTEKLIEAKYYGGMVSLHEYLQALDDATMNKADYDYTEEEAKKKFVRFERSVPSSEFSDTQEYMLMLSYDPVSEEYFVLCGGYGSPDIKDGKVYNAVEEEYVDIAQITAVSDEKH